MSTQAGGKTDTIVKVVLVFFISLLSFSVGTFIGKQVSDNDHRHVALESDAKDGRDIASTEEDGNKISSKDVENLSDEFVAQEKSGGAHDVAAKGEKSEMTAQEEKAEGDGFKSYSRGKKASDGEHAEEGTTEVASTAAPAKKAWKKKSEDVEHVASKVAEGEAPSDGMPEERKPSSILPSVATSAVGKFTVQVASYPEEKEAKTHAADLKTKGWNAFYLPAKIGDRTWYRVSVGLFNNDKTAQSFRAQFIKESGTKAAIIQKIIQ
jgi:cell division protein FtsN